MLKLAFTCFTCLLLITSQVSAGLIHRGGGGATGSATLNVGGEFFPQNVINVLHAGLLVLATPSDASVIDGTGYINGTPSGTVSLTYPSATSGPAWTGVTYKLIWPATITSKIILGGATTGCANAVNATFTGCTGASATITTTGGAGSITLTNNAAQLSIFFPGGFTYAHTGGEMALYRLSDEADYQAGKIYTPEIISTLKALNPRNLRFMGYTNSGSSNFNGETTWACRITPQDLSWRGRKLCPASYGGTVSGTDTYTIAPAPGSPSNWTDGEQIVGVIQNANTITTPTLTITGHTGAKTIVRVTAGAVLVGDLAANSLGTFTYDAVLDKVLYANGANAGIMIAGTPIEAQAALANAVGANMWATIPAMALDDYVTNWAAAALSSLRRDLIFYPEYGNEIWNNSFVSTAWATSRGAAFGFSAANGEQVFGWYGLRVRQIMGNLIPAVWSGRMSQLRRVLMFQGAGAVSATISFRMKGADLAPSGTSTGTGNALYSSYTGSADYTTKPNRPIDVVETYGYAPYTNGNNLCFGPDPSNGCTLNANMTPFYQALVTAWEAGNTAATTAMIDGDVRQGQQLIQTVTASGTTFTTPLSHGFTANSTNVSFTVAGGTSYVGLTNGLLYRVLTTPTASTFTIAAYANGVAGSTPVNAGAAGSGTVSVGSAPFASMLWMANNWYLLWEVAAAGFDSDRPAGMNPIRVETYEAALEPVGLTTAQCTTLGITSSQDCGTDIANAITAWKNDIMAAATLQTYLNQFIGIDPNMGATFGLMAHSHTPNWFVLECSPTIYALLSGCGPTTTPYQLYNGFAAFHGVP